MIKKLKDLLINYSNNEEETPQESISILNKACAALLIEVAFADKIFNESEVSSLMKILKETYSLEEEMIQDLIDDAKSIVDHSTLVNDEFSYADKLKLIESIWKIAFSDGNLDKYEDYLIRKISNLLHVSHSDFIKIKLESRRNQSSQLKSSKSSSTRPSFISNSLL